MNLMDKIHEAQVYGRRAGVLSSVLADHVPDGSSVLDVGCGDGLISSRLQDSRRRIVVDGIDVLVRPRTHIAVTRYDGRSFPFDDDSRDVVLFVDVLHHTDDPLALLQEARRVARKWIVIKDHLLEGLLAGPTLSFMDWVGNARHGVRIPANYWPKSRWRDAFRRLGLREDRWTEDVPLYPWWGQWAFGRSLHFVARLEKAKIGGQTQHRGAGAG
jgi:SAM-dependent methyltransferase